jgi:DNA-binding beta-propeller fold protein YncE
MKSSFKASLRITLAFLALLATASAVGQAADDQKDSPVTLVRTIYLPEIVGDFDHFTVDLKRGHLFVSAEVHHSIEMFDLRTGDHLKSIDGFKTPHSIAFDPKKDELMVADGGDSSLVLVSGEDFHRIDRIQLIDGSATGKGDSPDAAYYDSANRLYYIGNGGISANLPDSQISIFSVDQGKLVGSISIPGNNVESMGVDNIHHRLYVNVRDKHQVGVVDLLANRLITTWTTPDLNANTALVVDPEHERIFVAGRKPGIFYVFDRDGKVVAQKQCVNINDDMTWDPVLKRIYISGTEGLSIFHQDTPDTYSEIANIPTNGGKTSYFVPQTHQFFVIHPKTDVDIAGLLVYRVNR